ncbi:MAG: polysaccharide biosynthesis protein [Alistipes sp.]|nr:polysaccharide biosynthesis protein [Alistipes senegalensis]MCM1249571.1 polysaccharide biosynthesis protein [Alistipes sp.]
MIKRDAFFRKYLADRYLNAWLILGCDVVTSVCSSLLVLLLSDRWLAHMFGGRFMLTWFLGAAFFSLFMFVCLRTYRTIIRYSTLRDIGKIGLVVFGKEVLLGTLMVLAFPAKTPLPLFAGILFFDLAITIFLLIFVRVAMIVAYDLLKRRVKAQNSLCRVLVYGNGDKSVGLATRLSNSSHYCVSGFLTYGKHLKGHTVSGHPIYYFNSAEDLDYLCKRYEIDAVLFAYHTDAQTEQQRLVKYCQQYGIKMLMAPGIDELEDGKSAFSSNIRKIKIEDLLERPEIEISMNEIVANFKDKVVLVTGAAGSIGSELCRQLAHFGIRQLILFDNAETPLHNLRLEFEDKYPDLPFIPVIGDVRMEARLDFVFRTYHPQVVFHAAAYKHVPLMEENPCEAVLVNVVGSRNVADKCIEYGIESMVMISTDKAVNPTNIMGCTKRLAEIYIQSLGLAIETGRMKGGTRFVTTRFGNVLGSNGSVIPRFREQIAAGGPVTVTDARIERFFMTIPEACRLVMEAATISTGNQIFVFDMGEPVKIIHLAEQMIRLAGFEVGKDIRIEYVGLRPGEKLYEEVLASKENTLPTSHDRIRIAKIREYDYDEALRVVSELEELSRAVNIPEMVRLMKRTVPEYKSENSDFEKYDQEIAREEALV